MNTNPKRIVVRDDEQRSDPGSGRTKGINCAIRDGPVRVLKYTCRRLAEGFNYGFTHKVGSRSVAYFWTMIRSAASRNWEPVEINNEPVKRTSDERTHYSRGVIVVGRGR